MSPYPIKQLVLSHSTRSSGRSCMRKLEFAKMYGDSKLLRDESFAGTVGNCLHDGFQEFLINRNETMAHIAMMRRFPYDLEYQESANSSRSLEACYATLAAMVRSPVVEKYELVHIKDAKGIIRPAVEVPFAFRLLNTPMEIPVWFVGFIDAILYNPLADTYIVDDIKTTRQYITDMSARYEFDEQTVPYGIVLEHILGRSIDQFDVSYLSVFIDLMEPKVSLIPFTKTREHINDWMRGLADDVQRIAKYHAQGWFPRATNGDTCMAFKRPCHFIEYCSYREPEMIQRMIGGVPREGLFHDDQEPWIVADLDLGGFF